LKWKSVLFSDLANKLGDQIVGAKWKGRCYFRSYVIPANPKTNPQMAHRAVLANLVARYQEVAPAASAARTAWNAEALPLLISGYNLFVKQGRKSAISVPTTASGTGSADVEVTYTLGLAVDDAAILRYDGTNLVDVTPAAGLEAGANKTFTDTVTSSGTYQYFIANKKVLAEGDTAPQQYQAITKWTANEANGVADAADCEVTIT